MRRFGAGVGGVGDFLFEFTEGAGVFGFEAGELGGDAGLDVEFEVFGAGAVGLQIRLTSGLLVEYTRCAERRRAGRGKGYLRAGLQSIDELLREADGGFATRWWSAVALRGPMAPESHGTW